jgi:hypothetical protein
MPLDIPGTPIGPRDKPGSKKCPNCKRYYNKAIVKKDGKKIILYCPFCRAKIG